MESSVPYLDLIGWGVGHGYRSPKGTLKRENLIKVTFFGVFFWPWSCDSICWWRWNLAWKSIPWVHSYTLI